MLNFSAVRENRRGARIFYYINITACVLGLVLYIMKPLPGSVVVERSPGMREVGDSNPVRVKQRR